MIQQIPDQSPQTISDRTRSSFREAFRNAGRKLLLLDYDGTLVHFCENPERAFPDQKLLDLLGSLSRIPGTDVVIISGRDRKTLGAWFADHDVSLVAEHGAWLREAKKDWSLIGTFNNDWKGTLLTFFGTYARSLPGSFVENKEFSIAYHYRKADPHAVSIKVKELIEDLRCLMKNEKVQIVEGKKVLEMRTAGINKGKAAKLLLSKADYQFVMAIGDDRTDEDLFAALPERAHSIKVGPLSRSFARYSALRVEDVLNLLAFLLTPYNT